ncbi:MAG: nitrilase family protein [Bacteroidota bacterium]|nr:nitrilase family protein [Bacteroidota bacterium]
MKDLRISTAQFENKSSDKKYNLSVMESMAEKAAAEGSDAIAFHECSITGYTHARKLTRQQLLSLAEYVPDGVSTRKLIEIAGRLNMAILAGLFEKDNKKRIYKTYVCVDGNGLVAKHRKLHPFIHPAITPGDKYTVFELGGWKCGILICYDNNVVENVRATALLGAQVIFMPHVTMCTPSPRPGSGFVDSQLWNKKHDNPDLLRKEFDGPKGREWLMKWLPARAHDNGIYVVFSNPIGMDDDQLKNGCSMTIDPFGDIMAECRSLGDEFVTTTISEDKIGKSGGYRYTMARKPELYRDIIGKEHKPVQKVAWMSEGGIQ